MKNRELGVSMMGNWNRKMRSREGLLGGLLLASCLLASPSTAFAEPGFGLDRYDPSERGSLWFSADSLDIEGENRPAAGAVIDYARRPLVLRDANGDRIRSVVSDQLFVHLGGSVTFLDRLRIGLNLPILALQLGNRVIGPNGPIEASESANIGDLRLAADVRLYGYAHEPVVLSVGARAYFPTGSRVAFSSDGEFSALLRGQVAGRVDAFVYAANFGTRLRGREQNFGDEPIGHELVFGAAAGVLVLEDRLLFGPEIWASTVFADGPDNFFSAAATPAELAFVARVEPVPSFRIGLGAGPGLASGMGSPEWRGLFSLEWVPPVERAVVPPPPQLPPDRDSDGIDDAADHCPDQPGSPNPDPQLNGCPAPVDSDGDGLPDEKDGCPKEPGPPNPNDSTKNGCPAPADADGDGITDAEDACPAERGAPNPDKARNGCPVPADADNDGIPDASDACVNQAGTPSSDPKKNGCPRTVVTASEIQILDRIEFETGTAVLRGDSTEILTAVATALKDNPQIQRVSIEGHTDSRGAAGRNRALSRERAQAVLNWLTQNGIDASRLTAKGLGSDSPIDSNNTEEGRQKNRRVEFKIEKQAKPAE